MAISGIETTSSSNLKMDYMKLLVAQLQNQNPLEPMDNTQMTAQLTSLSQLEQLENMNTSFGEVLENTKSSYAQGLMGKTVSFYDYKMEQYVEGKVDKIITSGDGVIELVAGDYLIKLEEVLAVSENAASANTNQDDTNQQTII